MVPQFSQDEESLWRSFALKYRLTHEQESLFKRYYELLVATNDLHNLTAITDVESVIAYHFDDSLVLGNFFDLSHITMLADVGTGAGFPGIPLKIAHPHLEIVLIEVNHKKIEFLEHIIDEFSLKGVMVVDLDWRTFLRKTNYGIDLFCARASVQSEELLRVFKPSSPYKQAQLIYWASRHWKASEMEQPFMVKEEDYTVGSKKRKLVFFSFPKAEVQI